MVDLDETKLTRSGIINRAKAIEKIVEIKARSSIKTLEIGTAD